ncbi:MAG: zonular occludens toxin domain-containing protein [Nitrososphaerota archaeon]
MALIFITGTPGAGKSYYAVLRIVQELRDSSKLVITNIDGLDKQKVAFYLDKEDLSNLWTLDEFLSAVYGIANLHYDGNYRNAFLTLLNVDFWKRVILPYFYKELGYKRFIFYLDEFQSIIDEDTNLHQSQKFFFDYHRHLGIDIYLITQSVQRMNKAIRNIAEVELRLVNLRMFGLSSVVLLKTLIGGVVVKKKLLKYDPRIFVLYRSALVEHLKGVRGRPPVMLFVGLFLLLFALFQGFSYMSKTGGSLLPKSEVSNRVSNKVSNAVPNSDIDTKKLANNSQPSLNRPSSPPPSYPSRPPPSPPPSSSSLPHTPAPLGSRDVPPSGNYVIIYSPDPPPPPHSSVPVPSGPTIKVIR